jgi:hypothetical protein
VGVAGNYGGDASIIAGRPFMEALINLIAQALNRPGIVGDFIL